ncbi:hypothetical protein GKZ68_05330 [Hymenobacter sp. BRD128]|nr:hypothetical protein GKZ68_05330 [Hymenobacter sp. BRD128]
MLASLLGPAASYAAPAPRFFAADNPNIQYTGRVDFSEVKKPRFWAPGVYLTVRFKGPSCTVQLTDELLNGKSQNYVQLVVDGRQSRRKLTGPTNTLVVAENLPNTAHTLVICKDTEAGQGYVEFTGLTCARLLPPPPGPRAKSSLSAIPLPAATAPIWPKLAVAKASGTTSTMPTRPTARAPPAPWAPSGSSPPSRALGWYTVAATSLI